MSFKSVDLTPFRFVLFLPLPDTKAAWMLYLPNILSAIFSYKYCAVSVKAVKIIIFLLPSFMGWASFSSIRILRSSNFWSRSEVISLAEVRIVSILSLSSTKASFHLIKSISFNRILISLSPTIKSSSWSSSTSSKSFSSSMVVPLDEKWSILSRI